MPNGENLENIYKEEFRIWIKDRYEVDMPMKKYQRRINERFGMNFSDESSQYSEFKNHIRSLSSNGSGIELEYYEESEGSLVIIFILTILSNYGGYRETIDYIRDDCRFLLRTIFPNANIDVENHQINRMTRSTQNSQPNNAHYMYSRINRILGFVSIIIVIGFAAWYLFLLENGDKALSEEDVKAIIHEEIDKQKSFDNAEKTIHLLEQIKHQDDDNHDTVFIKLPTTQQ